MKKHLSILFCLLAISACSHQEPLPDNRTATPAKLQRGSQLQLSGLVTAQGDSVSLTPATQLLLFASDMSASALIQEVLALFEPACLQNQQVLFVADIAAMPGPIRRWIALPRMREWPYPVALDLDGTHTSVLPRQASQVTVIPLQQQQVQQQQLTATAKELQEQLTPYCQMRM